MAVLLLVWYVLSTLAVGVSGGLLIAVLTADQLLTFIETEIASRKQKDPLADENAILQTYCLSFLIVFAVFSASVYTIVFSLVAIGFGYT